MKITLVHSSEGDWVGMYFDDKLIFQDHSINLSRGLEFIHKDKRPLTKVDEFYAEDWLLDEGQLPDSLKEVKAKDRKFRANNKASSSKG